jgi:predicted AlkP superfamily pyrophosphatase or phosphodiesterase
MSTRKITRREFIRQLLIGGLQGIIVPRIRTLTDRSHPRDPVIVLVADGMRQDLMKQLGAEGKMPNYQRLLTTGVDAGKGLIPVMPANSAPNWPTMATGTSPGVHGATNNLFHDNRRRFTVVGVIGFMPWNHEGETIVEKAEAAGLTVVVLAWKTFEIRDISRGAALGAFPFILTGRGITANYDIPDVDLGLLELVGELGQKLFYTQVTLAPAAGWTNVPPGYSPAQETTFEVSPQLQYNVYIYDSTDDAMVNYDQVLISPTKDGADQVALLTAGQWSGSIPATTAWGSGKFYVKILDLEPDLSKFRLYFTSVTRVKAWPSSLAEDLATRFDGIMAWDDFYPLAAGLIDADTFAEQVLHWHQVVGDQMFPYVVETYQPDLVMAGTPVPDIIQHVFLALSTPGTEVYDPVLAPSARSFVESSYIGADRILGNLWTLMPSANVFALSDHGFSAVWHALYSHDLLTDAGLLDLENLSGSRAVPYETSGSVQIYINLEGRNPDGVVPVEEYEATRQQIVEIFQELGPTVVERVLLKEETETVITTMGVTMNMLHPDCTGDVVVFAKPPYHFGPEFLRGDHGYIPNGEEERFAAFTAGGPDIVPGRVISPVTALDIVPTVAFALGISAPSAAEGRVLPIFHPFSVFLPTVAR